MTPERREEIRSRNDVWHLGLDREHTRWARHSITELCDALAQAEARVKALEKVVNEFHLFLNGQPPISDADNARLWSAIHSLHGQQGGA